MQTGQRKTSSGSKNSKSELEAITYHLRWGSRLFFRNQESISAFLQTAKIGSLVDIQDSEDPEGLRIFYYLVQDLRVRYLVILTHTPSDFQVVVLHLFAHFIALQDQAHLVYEPCPVAGWGS